MMRTIQKIATAAAAPSSTHAHTEGWSFGSAAG
jgi:hypothetical protein